MKLEIKHLAPYLPYGLKMHCSGLWIDDNEDNHRPLTVEMVGLGSFVEYHEIGRTVTEENHFEDTFPIVRPLSDLTKVCTKEGEPEMNTLELIFGSLYRGSKNGGQSTCQLYPWDRNPILWKWHETQQLFKLHFDVFGLIKAGLAIDINTIKKK